MQRCPPQRQLLLYFDLLARDREQWSHCSTAVPVPAGGMGGREETEGGEKEGKKRRRGKCVKFAWEKELEIP